MKFPRTDGMLRSSVSMKSIYRYKGRDKLSGFQKISETLLHVLSNSALFCVFVAFAIQSIRSPGALVQFSQAGEQRNQRLGADLVGGSSVTFRCQVAIF